MNTKASAYGLGLGLLIVGCVPEFPVPAGTAITCGAEQDCPDGWSCDLTVGRCLLGSTPSVSIGAISRTTGEVLIPVAVHAVGDDPVTVTVVLEWNGERYPIEVTEQAAGGLEGVGGGAGGPTEPERSGDATELVWDAPTFFEAHGFPGSPLVRDLVVELTPSDASGAGPAVTSESFLFGNDPPEISELQIHGVSGTEVSGEVVLSFVVSDSSGDEIELDAFEVVATDNGEEPIEVEVDADIVAVGDDDRSGSVALDFDGVGEVGGQPATLVQALLWRSVPTVPGRREGVRLRFTVVDAYLGTSVPIDSAPFTVDNAPRLEVALVDPLLGRAADAADSKVTVMEPNPGQAVDLSVQFTVGAAGDPVPATLGIPGIPNPTGLYPTPTGTTYGLTWNALADAPSTAGLGTVLLDTDGDGVCDTTGLAYAPDLRLLVSASDSAGGETPARPSVPFALGNDPPVAVLTDLSNLLTPPLAGALPVELRILDSAGDPTDLELEFRSASDQPWRSPSLLLGASEDLAASPAGTVHVLIWDSAALADADVGVPQGLGPGSFPSVEIRARGVDRPDGSRTCYGPWDVLALPQISN